VPNHTPRPRRAPHKNASPRRAVPPQTARDVFRRLDSDTRQDFLDVALTESTKAALRLISASHLDAAGAKVLVDLVEAWDEKHAN